MTPEQIEEMKRDLEAGTPGPWKYTEAKSSYGDEWFGCGVEIDLQERIWFEDSAEADIPIARRIARVPDMEAHILAQQAEIDRLRAKADPPSSTGLHGDNCDQCGRKFHVIFRVPTEVWGQIAPHPETVPDELGGVLCPDCAAIAAEAIGQRLYFEAVTGGWCIADLREEIDRLRADTPDEAAHDCADHARRLAEENARLRAKVDSLRAALSPLKEYAVERVAKDPGWRDRDTVTITVTIEQLRTAYREAGQ